MAIYLDEDQVGADPQTIGFPHLLLCMGVAVVMGDGSLIGAHVSDSTTENIVLGELLNQINHHGGAMSQLYCFSDVNEHCGRHGCGDITAKANALGFHGPGHLFDFGYIDPQDGAYVEITSNGAAAAATVRFKRNEKVAYTNTGTGPAVTNATQDFFGAPKISNTPSNTIAVAGKPKKFLGWEYGTHQIKTVAPGQMTAFAL